MKEGQQPSFEETQQRQSDLLYQRNPEWQALKGREHRMPNQFGGEVEEMPFMYPYDTPRRLVLDASEEQELLSKAVEGRIIFEQ